MFEALLTTLGAGLSLWNHKEKTRYVDKLMRLKRDYYAELNKPDDSRSNAIIDQLDFELRLLCSAFAAGVPKPDV